MSTTRLPELPEPPSYVSAYDDAPLTDHYSAGQMHAYGLAVWKAAMDRAVAECEFAKPQNERSDWTEYAHVSAKVLDRAIFAIRSLPLPELAGSPQERRE